VNHQTNIHTQQYEQKIRKKNQQQQKKQGEGGYSIVAIVVVVLPIAVGHFLKGVK
jgi:hypothetical protein